MVSDIQTQTDDDQTTTRHATSHHTTTRHLTHQPEQRSQHRPTDRVQIRSVIQACMEDDG
jgi:hypothetical protein